MTARRGYARDVTGRVRDGRRVALLVAVPGLLVVALLVPTFVIAGLWDPAFFVGGIIAVGAMAIPVVVVGERCRASAPHARRGDAWSEPDPRPFGALGLGLAILSALLAPTYFFSAYAYLAAALAITLGLMARGIPRIRAIGTAAVILAVVATVVATVALVVF